MANEFVHATVGTSLSQIEFEAVGLHVLNSQATGDLIYASSASQLSRIGIGAANTVLHVVGTTPAWSATLAGLTLTAPTINGTIATTGLTLPAFTLGGNVTLSDTMNISQATATDKSFYLKGGTNTAGAGAVLALTGKTVGWAGRFILYTPGAAGTTDAIRLSITGVLATAVATWSNITHTGLVLGGNMTTTGYGFVGPVISTNSYMEVTEMAAPGAGAANTARIYAVVGGDTFTDLAAVFQDGTVDIFAQETTPLDSPIFTEADETEIKMVQLKPHPGIIQFAVKYPNGKTHILKEIQYHNEDKIKANKGCKDKRPSDWEVETTVQMEARLAKFEQDRLDAIELSKNAVMP